jgi:hypothetical protein
MFRARKHSHNLACPKYPRNGESADHSLFYGNAYADDTREAARFRGTVEDRRGSSSRLVPAGFEESEGCL